MSSRHYRETWSGPAGQIEILFDHPETVRGVAVIAPPNPTLGGTAEHKVPAILARTLREAGWLCIRPNFRGTGESEGTHDHGLGETEDFLAVAQRAMAEHAGIPFVLIGFSFGAYVQICVSGRLHALGEAADRLVLVGPGIGQVEGGRHYEAGDVPADTFTIHGERDERVPLENVLRWAELQSLPVTVVPGSDHFFTRRLPVLANAVRTNLEGLMLPGRLPA